MKRIYSIDFFKLLFAYLIALGHFGANVAPGGGVTVQLFFIISGFFLGKKFYEKRNANLTREYNQCDYTKDHLKSLYPHYIFSLLILALYFLLKQLVDLLRQPSLSQVSVILKDLYSLIPELFLLQNTGFFGGGINYPLWQLCVLVICSYFIYGLLCVNEKLSREIIFPAAILMIQAFLKTGVNLWGTEGFFHVPLLRAFSPLCIGVLTYYLTTTHYYKYIKSKKWLFNIASILSFVTLFVYKSHESVFLITFVVLLLAMYDTDSWINKLLNYKIFKSFGTLSYAVYLNHALIKYVLVEDIFPRISKLFDFQFSDSHRNIIFLVVLTIYSIITMCAVNKFVRVFPKKTPIAQSP